MGTATVASRQGGHCTPKREITSVENWGDKHLGVLRKTLTNRMLDTFLNPKLGEESGPLM